MKTKQTHKKIGVNGSDEARAGRVQIVLDRQRDAVRALYEEGLQAADEGWAKSLLIILGDLDEKRDKECSPTNRFKVLSVYFSACVTGRVDRVLREPAIPRLCIQTKRKSVC